MSDEFHHEHAKANNRQKTGYFYDHRDNRRELAKYAATVEGDILDCFSYVGSWGLQALKNNRGARLTAIDVLPPVEGRRDDAGSGLAASIYCVSTGDTWEVPESFVADRLPGDALCARAPRTRATQALRCAERRYPIVAEAELILWTCTDIHRKARPTRRRMEKGRLSKSKSQAG